jgi:metal-responsive CopG/Arc/MetJ family transcriptional regulator
MKTAVSLPDDLFRQADAAARRLRVSRSELYSKAIEEFLQNQEWRCHYRTPEQSLLTPYREG